MRIVEQSMLCAKTSRTALMVWRLATYECSPSDRSSRDVSAPRGAWRQGVLRQAIDSEIGGLGEAWKMAAMVSRQAVCTGILPSGAWVALGDSAAGIGLRVLFVRIDARLRSGDVVPWAVGSWMVVNTWWYERGCSYFDTFVWGYERVGLYVPSSHLRDAASGEVRSWWITCVGLWACRSVE